MRYCLSLLALVFSFCLMGVACAAPSLIGTSGLLFVPTSETVNKEAYSLGAYASAHSNVGFAINYGALPNFEAGFTRLGQKQTIINAKYRFFEESEKHVGVALGVLDATDQVDVTLYTVASAPFSLGDLYGIDNFHANLGISSGSDVHSPVPLNGLFGGISFDIDPVTVMVEHNGSSFNYGVRAEVSEGLLAEVGVTGRGSDLTLGVTYVH